MTSIGVLSTSYMSPNMARADDGLHASRLAPDFSAILKAKADSEFLQALPEETHARFMQAAIVPRRPEIDAMLLQLSAGRKMVLTVAVRAGRPTPASAVVGTTVENCILTEEGGMEDTDSIDASRANGGTKVLCTGYARGSPARQLKHCAHGLTYGFPVECPSQSSATAVALSAYIIVWTPAETRWPPMQSPYRRSRRRQRWPIPGNISKSEPQDPDEG